MVRRNSSPTFAKYIHSTEMQEKLYKRTLIVVVISQIFGGAGLAAGITVGALIAQDMLGTTSYAGSQPLYLHLDLLYPHSS